MKKYVLFLFAVSCACISYAQVLKINQMEYNEDDERVVVKEIQHGDVIEISTEGSFIQFDSDVINASNAAHIVGLNMVVSSGYTEGIDIGGCWWECLASWNFDFREDTIEAGKSVVFSVDYFTNEIQESQAWVTCTFIVDGVDDFVFHIKFGDAVSVKEPMINVNKIYPNPAVSVVNIDYAVNKGNAQIALYNILGVNVYEQMLNNQKGTVKINVSDFVSGVYFYTIKVDGKIIETKKLIISR